MPDWVDHYGHWTPTKTRQLLPPHKNRGLEIVVVERGRLDWMVEGQRITVEPGSVFFTLPWELHGGVDAPQPATELWFAVILLDRVYDHRPAALAFNPALGLSAADARQLSQAFLSATARCLPASERLRWLAPELVTELDARAAGRAAAVAGLIKLTLVELTRCIAVAERAPAPPTSPAAQRVRAFLATLTAESAAPWTLDEMARRCGLGRSQFSELFKTLTGETPITHLNRLRVRQAEHQLRATRQTITDIAYACGFSSSQYFARVFKAFTGREARSYRLSK